MFRDLTALRESGVPIEFDSEHDRYSIPGAYFLPPINFTAAESLSLMAIALEMGRGRLPFHEAAHSAVLKLEGSLPPGLREQLRDMPRAIEIRPSQVSDIGEKRGYYQQLVEAPPSRSHRVR
jgi:predicted DNA-binding transcriptional regulator YafY